MLYSVEPIDFDIYRCLQPTAMLYLVELFSGAQVEYKPVDLQSYEARNGASLEQTTLAFRRCIAG